MCHACSQCAMGVQWECNGSTVSALWAMRCHVLLLTRVCKALCAPHSFCMCAARTHLRAMLSTPLVHARVCVCNSSSACRARQLAHNGACASMCVHTMVVQHWQHLHSMQAHSGLCAQYVCEPACASVQMRVQGVQQQQHGWCIAACSHALALGVCVCVCMKVGVQQVCNTAALAKHTHVSVCTHALCVSAHVCANVCVHYARVCLCDTLVYECVSVCTRVCNPSSPCGAWLLIPTCLHAACEHTYVCVHVRMHNTRVHACVYVCVLTSVCATAEQHPQHWPST